MSNRRILWLMLVSCLWLTQSIATAQSPTIITVTAPEYQGDLYEDTIIPLFEAEHPNIQVEFVYAENTYFGNPLYQAEGEESTFYDDLAAYASSADVLYVSGDGLSPYALNTGFFLDLSPLIAVDDTINEADFYPATWRTFQWGGGMWALPTTIMPQVLVYDRAAFDAVNSPYPDESWQFEDYIHVAEEMHTYNSQGEVELSPITAISPINIVYGSIGKLYDPMTMPIQPDFSDPEIVRLLQTYTDYYSSYEFAAIQGYSFNEIPMSITYPYQLNTNGFSPDAGKDWAISLLPGNLATSRVEGFAISSGTAYPEAAYTFASFMTENIDVFSYGSSGKPARRFLSLDGLEDEDTFYTPIEFDPEIQAIMDEAYEVAIASSDLWFAEAFYLARSEMDNEGLSAEEALENQRLKMIDLLEEASTYQSTQITVAAPTLPPDLADGEIVLNFGMNIQRGNNDRQSLWDDAIDVFIAEHPTVGAIDLDYQIYGPDGMDEEIACWYDGYGGSFGSLTEAPEGLLALNPLMSADPNYDPNSFLPGVLDAVKVADLLYGYPLTVQPITMWINKDKFAEANIPIPANGWTTNEFVNAVAALSATFADDDDPIIRNNLYSPIWLIMLIGSYGGQPIDNSTDPPTYNLTDEQTVNAIAQIITQIDDGLIDYSGLLENSSVFFSGAPENDTILIDVMGDSNFLMMNDNSLGDDFPLQVVTYPDGVYMPVAYSTGTAYINSDSLYFQECYDWISTLAEQPELFTGMPSRPMMFNDPDLITQQGSDVVALYETLAQNLSAPNMLLFPSTYSPVNSTQQGAWLEPNFLYQALDNVVLNGAELEAELMQAQENLDLFRQCTGGIEQLSQQQVADLWEENESDGQAYMRQFIDCATTILPELRDMYSYYYQDED